MQIMMLLELRQYLEINIQYSIQVHILFPFIEYMSDDHYRKLETILVQGAE